jgi:hypothetical protein
MSECIECGEKDSTRFCRSDKNRCKVCIGTESLPPSEDQKIETSINGRKMTNKDKKPNATNSL